MVTPDKITRPCAFRRAGRIAVAGLALSLSCRRRSPAGHENPGAGAGRPIQRVPCGPPAPIGTAVQSPRRLRSRRALADDALSMPTTRHDPGPTGPPVGLREVLLAERGAARDDHRGSARDDDWAIERARTSSPTRRCHGPEVRETGRHVVCAETEKACGRSHGSCGIPTRPPAVGVVYDSRYR